jgi:hypothetical protein
LYTLSLLTVKKKMAKYRLWPWFAVKCGAWKNSRTDEFGKYCERTRNELKTKARFVAGIILFIVANSYASWNYTRAAEGTEESVKVPAGHFCIFDTPQPASAGSSGLEVDMSRVAIQGAMILLFTLVVAATFGQRRAETD